MLIVRVDAHYLNVHYLNSFCIAILFVCVFFLVRTTTEEEREDKYHRLLAASLQSFSMFLVALSDSEREEAADSFRPLLKNAKFWKFGKHAVGAVCCVMTDVWLNFSCRSCYMLLIILLFLIRSSFTVHFVPV